MITAVQGASVLGLLADTHDNLPRIDEAVRQLNRHDVELVLHAGDYISPFTVTHYKPLHAHLIGVYGNNCAERQGLKEQFRGIGGDLRGFFAEVTVKDLKIGLLHGHDEELLTALIHSGAYDVVVHGHTHHATTQRVGRTLVINPGEVCGYLTGKATLALLDVKSRAVEIVGIRD